MTKLETQVAEQINEIVKVMLKDGKPKTHCITIESPAGTLEIFIETEMRLTLKEDKEELILEGE